MKKRTKRTKRAGARKTVACNPGGSARLHGLAFGFSGLSLALLATVIMSNAEAPSDQNLNAYITRPKVQRSVCGDGKITGREQCDDRNTRNGTAATVVARKRSCSSHTQ